MLNNETGKVYKPIKMDLIFTDENLRRGIHAKHKTTFVDDIWNKDRRLSHSDHMHYSIGPMIHLNIDYIFDALQPDIGQNQYPIQP